MINEISAEDFYRLTQTQELAIIDVREMDEFANGHIQTAKLLPLSTLMQQYTQLNKAQKYYIICRSGNRSGMACQFLSAQGYDVINVLGGMNAWKGVVA